MSTIVDEPEAYFRQLARKDDPLLRELELEAEREHIPIVGPVVGELLFILSRACGARSILELGTAMGYSTIFLARACALDGGAVTTLEHDPAFAARARKNLGRAGLADQAKVVCGDAFAELLRMRGGFDLIFMDIDERPLRVDPSPKGSACGADLWPLPGSDGMQTNGNRRVRPVTAIRERSHSAAQC